MRKEKNLSVPEEMDGWRNYTRRAAGTLMKVDRNLLFSFLTSMLFLTAAFLNILHHEMWRDELQAWLIGRDSTSVIELLFHNIKI